MIWYGDVWLGGQLGDGCSIVGEGGVVVTLPRARCSYYYWNRGRCVSMKGNSYDPYLITYDCLNTKLYNYLCECAGYSDAELKILDKS